MKDLQIISKQMPSVTANFDEVKEALLGEIEQYRGLVVTEDTLKGCKQTQKDIARIRKGIDSYRKTIKKELTQPIKDFEDKCKGLIALVSDVEEPIKEGLAKFEQDRINDKKKKINLIIIEKLTELGISETHLKDIEIDKSWTNATKTVKSIRENVKMQCQSIKDFLDRKERDYNAILTHIEQCNESFELETPVTVKEFNLTKLSDGSYDIAYITTNITSRCRIAKDKEIALRKKVEEEKAPVVNKVVPEVKELPKEKPIVKPNKITIVISESDKNKVTDFLMDNFIDFEII
jgi:hypothetical protein